MKLTVQASSIYDIFIEDNFALFDKEIQKVFKKGKVLIISDSNVAKLYLDEVKIHFYNYEVFTLVLEAGEKTKSFDSLLVILKYLSDACFTRSDFVVALGGGVVGDLVGFASSVYMRGIRFMSIPTTLLSLIDSSVGGKTAIDFNGIKNNVGSFYQPSLVYINTSLLSSLSELELHSGLGEAVKYAFLSKTIKPSLLYMSNQKDINSLVYKCLKIKKEIVEKDEFDTNERFLLNLGHTIGHAIEALSDYTIPHGICVVKGIRAIIDISHKYYEFSDNIKTKMINLLDIVNVDSSIPYTKNEIVRKLSSDKKANNKGINFVLLKNIGEPFIQFLTFDEVKELF